MRKLLLSNLVVSFTHRVMAVLVFTCFMLTGVKAAENKPQFSCMAWGKLPHTQLYYANGKKFVPLELIKHRRSEVHSMKPSETFSIYIKKEKSNGKMGHQLVGQATYPKGTKRMFFIIAKANATDKDELPLTIIGVDDSLSAFPPGTFRFANFTNVPMKINLGNVSKVLRSKDIKVYKAKMAPKGGLMSMIIQDRTGKPIFARRLFGQPKSRDFVIIAPSGKDKKILRTVIIPEIIVPEKEDVTLSSKK